MSRGGEVVGPLRIALVGCGAVSQAYYVPALRAIPEHSVEWFVDTRIGRARQLARSYGQGNATRTYEETISKVDAAILALPNFLHSKVSIDFLSAGRDVLCEKPLATSVAEGRAMIEASRKSGARLAVNLIRRRFDNYRIARDLVRRGVIGNVTRVSVEEGDVLAWPLASLFMLDRNKAGGGTLMDWGSHVIDILHWLFAGRCSVISYSDDALGGVEADCEAQLKIESEAREIPCSIMLSRARRLRNSLLIQGERGTLEVRPWPFGPNGVCVLGGEHIGRLGQDRSRVCKSQVDYFADQLRAFTDRSCTDIVDGNEALESLAVIEECYLKRKDMIYPWEKPSESETGRSIPSRYGKILVIGASGFVGTRLVQRLILDLRVNVRAAIHRPETAARLGRLPAEFVECDLLESSQVMKCVEGCDVVVNCARDRSGDSKKSLEVFVRGTENLLEAAAKHRVKKFVQISSAAVHGFEHKSGVIDESTRLRTSSDPYVRGKTKSEELVMAHAQVFPVVILRPTLIYGPFSADWVVGMIQRVSNQAVTLIGQNKHANLTFVDDVVDAILLAIEKEEANGQAFVINDDEHSVSWRDYVQWYSDMLGIAAVGIPNGSRISLALEELGSLLKDSAVAVRDVLGSAEMLALIARIPLVLVVGSRLIKGEGRTRIESKLGSNLQASKPEPGAVLRYEISRGIYEVLNSNAVFSASKAKRLLGFRPHTSLAEGMGKTSEWIKWARLA